ncbi:MAG: citrate transporter [Caulobacter sp.]|nr:citrate transporter [Caulobacter sp.]
MPPEFFLFAAVLAGVAFLHRRAFTVAVVGLAVIVLYKALLGGYDAAFFLHRAQHEWSLLANLFLLLTGFPILSAHFERSQVPDFVPRALPDNWTGGIVLLAYVFVASLVIDNIAAAVIGSVVARHVFAGKVSLAYLVAIVGSANVGGAPSVIGDTTTTMMWISGVSPLFLLTAFVATIPAFLVMAVFASRAQAKIAPMVLETLPGIKVHWARLFIVIAILASVVAANIAANGLFPGLEEKLPVLGLAMWLAILVTALLRKPEWGEAASSVKGAVFLVCLVASATLMPLDSLPDPSGWTVFGLGFLSSVFDNIPLTALALQQGDYDWPLLAFAVGFGGSMTWFGSTAGVAVSNANPEARSVFEWIKAGWFVPVAYCVGFIVMIALLGWNSDAHPPL